ncbi:MAG: zinc-binding alcohol dehydrogenase/oxidoreductase [Cellvibrionaceae bacterium]|jgi:zinc-binding alcohol dehydrogenase/oxidoreductase
MKAQLFTEIGQPLHLQDVPKPIPNADEIVVRLKAASLNHRDNWILKGQYPNLRAGTILGSCGAGITADGREVIINPNRNWGDDSRFPAKEYQILGMPIDGTFAEQIAVKPDRLVDKPPHLSFEQASALPLAGMTAWRALMTRAAFRPTDRVLISGIGGGVALFAFQFAVAAGAEVFVTSSSAEKIAKSIEMGGKGGANYRGEKWAKTFMKETGGFDVIIDSAGGKGFADLVKLTRPGGRIALYGGTRGNWAGVSPQMVFFRQLSILGSTMATDLEFAEMVEFVNQHKMVPVVDSVFPLADAAQAINRMDQGEQFGKIVLSI